MNGKQLKNSILQWAIQGKLVPQNSKDEPASKLLERIAATRNGDDTAPSVLNESSQCHPERSAKGTKSKDLAKKKKSKKETSRIYREGSSWFEQVGSAEPKDITEEIPFDIPESWEWCRFGNVVFNRDAERIPLSVDQRSSLAKLYDYYGASGVIDKVDDFLFDKPLLLIGEDGANLINRSTPIAFIAKGKYWVNNHAHVLDALNEDLLLYVCTYINSISLVDYVTGTAQPKMNQEKMNSILVALPPLAEQKRIVKKLEQILPLVDEYDQAQIQLDKLNKELPETLKKSILQQAIQGKLVPQNPKDEPADKLLERITISRHSEHSEESSKKSRKSSSKNPVSRIYRDTDGLWYEQTGSSEPVNITEEIPFEIPEIWAWCRLRGVVSNRGQKTPTETFSYIDIGSIDNKKQKLNDKENLVDASKAPSRARKIVGLNDILYSTVRPYLHNMCIIDREFSAEPIASTGFAVMTCGEMLEYKYLFYYLLSPDFDSYANDGDNAKGVAYPAINDEKLYNALVPLPPLAEQKRIVAKLEQLFKAL